MQFKIKNYRIGVYVTLFMEHLARRASKAQKNWVDKIIVQLVSTVLSTKKDNVDFMADQLVESEPEFDLAELEAFEKGNM